MDTLFDFYKGVADFAQRHRMIDNFKVITSPRDISALNFDSRTLFLSVESSGINHKSNVLQYSVYAYVVDKCIANDDASLILTIQENIFVLSQLQDFILETHDVNFDEIKIAQAPNTDYTQSAAFCVFTIDMDKMITCDSANVTNPGFTGVWAQFDEYSFKSINEQLGDSFKPDLGDAYISNTISRYQVGNEYEFLDIENYQIRLLSAYQNVPFTYELYMVMLGRIPLTVGDPFPNNTVVLETGSFVTSSVEGQSKLLSNKTIGDYFNENLIAWAQPYPKLLGIKINGDTQAQVGIAQINYSTGVYLY